MSSISKPHVLASLAVAFAIVGNVVAQDQAEQNQSNQAEQSQSDQSQQQQSDDQTASQQSDSQSDQQAQQDQQRQQQEQQEERQRQQREQQQQQEQQRQEQSQQRGQQSQDRDQSSRRDYDSSRDREWPQPDGHDYGSDSLRFPGNEQFSRDGQRNRGQQGGLGVGLRSDGREGVVVSHVHSGSPAEEMGIRQGDRITAVNGREIQSVQQFIARIRNMDPGQQIELDIRRARGGDEQTVRGELETRQEALAEHADEGRWYGQQGGRQSYLYGPQDRGEWQTSYDERRGYSSDRTGPMSAGRLEQIERQVDRLSRELDNLRVALQSIRRQSGPTTEGNRERTARYDEYQGARRDSQGRLDGRDTYREADRDRDTEFSRDGSELRDGSDRGESRDRFDEGPGGEIGSDRQRVGSENIQDRN
jgi:hypothetical protein